MTNSRAIGPNTRRLCERIVATTQNQLDASALSAARQLVLDGISVAVAGAATEAAPSILADYYSQEVGPGRSSVIGLGRKLAASQAAMVNAASMHVLDYEPMWMPATHALSPALGATLALGEAYGASGGAIATALLKGIEIQGVLRQAGLTESRDLKFHPPGVVGPFGSAVASAHLLEFDSLALANTLGVVSSRCGGLFPNLGTMTKSTHCGYAAAAGVEAALLTQRGLTGSTGIFDAKRQGFVHAFMPPHFDFETLMEFGPPLRALGPGYSIKMFPAKFSTHYGIVAALDLRRDVPRLDDIARISIVAADVPSSDRPLPESGLDGKFSLQYTVAAALIDGKVDIATFTDQSVARPQIRSLLSKTDVTLSDKMSSLYGSDRYTEVTATLTDGSVVSRRCNAPPGSWGGDRLSTEQHRDKARSCLSLRLRDEEIEEVLTLCGELEKLSPKAVRRLLDLARGPNQRPDGEYEPRIAAESLF